MSTAIFIARDDARLLGKNQDVPYDGAYLFTNRRGAAKRALITPPDRPAEWISRYGSLTVSQVGKEMPNGGMNEAGLAVEQTTLWQSDYPNDGSLPAIGELPWIQLLLDTCATVQEATEAVKSVRIAQPMARLHYIVCDRSGDCAVVEFIDGAIRVHRNETLPLPIIANTSYIEAIRDLEDGDERWRRTYGDYDRNSMERFARAAARLVLPLPSSEADRQSFTFETLEAVRREDTAYSLVYDLQRMELHFASGRYPERKTVKLGEIDFSPGSPALALNVQQPGVGTCDDRFAAYDTSLNRMVAESFFRDPVLSEAFGWSITEEMIHFIAAFPDRFPNETN